MKKKTKDEIRQAGRDVATAFKTVAKIPGALYEGHQNRKTAGKIERHAEKEYREGRSTLQERDRDFISAKAMREGKYEKGKGGYSFKGPKGF